MALGKLRMKGKSGDEPPRKRRRRSRSPDLSTSTSAVPPNPGSDDINGSAIPPFQSSCRGAQSEQEELVLNWTTTSPRVAAKLLSAPTDSTFRERLFDALAEDDPLDALETQYGFTMPSRWRSGSTSYAQRGMGRAGLDAMEEDEYAEYIRRNMWRRTHREEVRMMEEREEERSQKEKEAKEARRKRRAEDKERQRKVDEKATRKAAKERQLHRDSYAAKWATLTPADPVADSPSLRYSDIPWPTYPSSEPAAGLTAEEISEFLLAHIPRTDQAARRKSLRAAVLAYHPDRFTRLLAKVREDGGGRQKAEETALRVSQILNELNAGLDKS